MAKLLLRSPASVLRVRGTADRPLSARWTAGNMGLWDHTNEQFCEDTQPQPQGWVVMELPFEELPPKAQEYVRLISRIAYAREQGSGAQYMAALKTEAATLLRELMHEHTSTLRSNVGNRPSLQRKLNDIRTGGLYYSPRVPIR